MKRAVLLLGLAALTAGAVTADGSTNLPASVGAKSIFSHTQRFSAAGFPSAQALTIVGWAEDVARRFESFTGLSVPFPRGSRIDFRAEGAPGDPVGHVARAQGVADGTLMQRIRVGSPERIDQEDLLEAVSWMFFNRVAREAGKGTAPDASPATPDWLSVGIAQNLYVEQRERNLDIAGDLIERDSLPGLREVLKQSVLPAGRWDEKSVCGTFAAFLHELKAPWGELAREVGSGRALTPEALRLILSYDSFDSLEKAWRRWLDRALANRVKTGIRSADAGADLRGVLAFQLSTYEIRGTNAPSGTVTLSGLIPYRDEPWIPPLCERLTMEIARIVAGSDVDFSHVAELYIQYLQALGERKSARGSKAPRAAKSPERLGELLLKADSAFAAWDSRQGRIRAYMDEFEKRPPEPVPDGIRLYMDALEREMQ